MAPRFRKRRLHALLGEDGRTLIVAMDHLPRGGGGPRLGDPGPILRAAETQGADAVILRHGPAARLVRETGRLGLILSFNGEVPRAVETALRLAADAVKVVAFPGAPGERDDEGLLGRLAADCELWGMPLLSEMIPVSFQDTEHHTPGNVAAAARLGADLGADLVKVPFAGDSASFREVVELARVPVVILGGSRRNGEEPGACGGEEHVLTAVRQALDAGAAGAAVGRNVWAHPRPERMIAALVRLVHGDATVGEAMSELREVSHGVA